MQWLTHLTLRPPDGNSEPSNTALSSRRPPPAPHVERRVQVRPCMRPQRDCRDVNTSLHSMSSIRSTRTGRLSGQWTIPLRSGTQISIHAFSLGVRDLLVPTANLPFSSGFQRGDLTLSGCCYLRPVTRDSLGRQLPPRRSRRASTRRQALAAGLHAGHLLAPIATVSYWRSLRLGWAFRAGRVLE